MRVPRAVEHARAQGQKILAKEESKLEEAKERPKKEEVKE